MCNDDTTAKTGDTAMGDTLNYLAVDFSDQWLDQLVDRVFAGLERAGVVGDIGAKLLQLQA
eukprot:7111936-Karenia_brevis.AAC.1